MTLYATPKPARPWDTLLKKPFARLVRHCLDRIFYGGDAAQEDELDLGIGVALGLLALPGVLVSFFLIDKYGSLFQVILGIKDFDPYAASMPDEYFFIALSLVVTASVAIWKWDSLLPDRRDYANLAPLPIPNRTFFSANLLALAFLTAIMSLDVNAASIMAFPLVVTGSRSSFTYYAVFLVAHLTSLLLASLFSFLVVLAILGVLMSVLPYRRVPKIRVVYSVRDRHRAARGAFHQLRGAAPASEASGTHPFAAAVSASGVVCRLEPIDARTHHSRAGRLASVRARSYRHRIRSGDRCLWF